MSTEPTLALIAATVSVASATIAVVGQFRLARYQATVNEERDRRAKEDEARRLVAQFRQPLASAAFDLQSRVFNMVCLDVLDRFHEHGTEREKRYVLESTLFVFAQYLGWTEIIRRELQFLDLGDIRQTRRLAQLQFDVCEALLCSDLPPRFRIFRTDQRAIGELMILADQHPPQCLGPAGFVGDSGRAARQWLAGLEADVTWLARQDDRRVERLVLLQHLLVDLLDFLDPDACRFPRSARRKIPVSDNGTGRRAPDRSDGGRSSRLR